MSLQAYRGMLAVGRLLDDPALIREALVAARRVRRAGVLPRRASGGRATLAAHRRVARPDRRLDRPAPAARPRVRAGARLALDASRARRCGRGVGRARRDPRPARRSSKRPGPRRRRRGPRRAGPARRGGTGAAGRRRGDDALDLELRGLDDFGAPTDPSAWRSGWPSAAGRSWATSTSAPSPYRAATAPPPATTRWSSTGSTSASRPPWPASRPPAATSSSSPPTPTSRSSPSTTAAPIRSPPTRYRQTRHGRLRRRGPLCGLGLRGPAAGSSTTSSSTRPAGCRGRAGGSRSRRRRPPATPPAARPRPSSPRRRPRTAAGSSRSYGEFDPAARRRLTAPRGPCWPTRGRPRRWCSTCWATPR